MTPEILLPGTLRQRQAGAPQMCRHYPAHKINQTSVFVQKTRCSVVVQFDCLAAGLDFGELSRAARRAPRKRGR
jgi:hypothetical protein